MKKKTYFYIASIIILVIVLVGYLLSAKETKKEYTEILNTLEGSECELVAECGDLISINCMAEVDGPFYYVNKNTKKIVSRCGGFCDRAGGCPNACPPVEWSCNPKESKL
ncbi:hypothetical protein A2914_00915 [Candidatus Nomurabacteria bacterium RIFCSPLOWO2_01_FULL_41_21]|uniref:Uncharacterized protein n=2 Tax=Candidatus Nomuraibacteriota TaxID=1752729 RepID=A0A1F6V254_9BACT|nr:MAG: hypothetical protein A2733_02005 [Candidatus Nomurabacteria bacterium RIFCSPHIGHO2_01_FULL_40_20]OGI87877.1 MAG: hypothetical protein A2914_00915 [Candidatus Nomurabacteria bacterium RIFCSPLOWO2_01_FULL_41_21]